MNVQLGEMHASSFEKDPKHLAFVLARYHFVARMLQGKERVLEVGCGDGTGARLVQPVVGQLVGCDKIVYSNIAPSFTRVTIHDLVQGPLWASAESRWDAIYMLDVFEHIDPSVEDVFLDNIADSIWDNGVCIVGIPSLESQPYASQLSRLNHVNCKTEEQFRETLERHFHNVFLFGMNDTTLHTGFGPMCHYRLAICTGKR